MTTVSLYINTVNGVIIEKLTKTQKSSKFEDNFQYFLKFFNNNNNNNRTFCIIVTEQRKNEENCVFRFIYCSQDVNVEHMFYNYVF